MAEEKKPVNPGMGLGIVVDDGYTVVPIFNTHEEKIGEFHFRPTDVGIVNRFGKLSRELPEIIKPLENLGIRPDGTAESGLEEDAAVLEEAKEKLFAACNEFFGGDFAEAFFGKMHPFSPVKGHMYCENAINAVRDYITNVFGQEAAARNEEAEQRVGKYTHGYEARSGGHKNGKQKKKRKGKKK